MINVSKYTLAAFISFIEDVEFATSAWLAVNVPGLLIPPIDITLDVLPSSLPICSVWLFEDHATSPNSKVLGVAVFADLL